MRVGVLGPVTLIDGVDAVALGGPKQRLVLGLLVAHAGRIVPIDDLTDALWPEGPQAKPRKTVQVYVTRLRRLLGEHSDAIEGVAAGYRFDPGRVALDAAEFEASLSAALVEPDDETAVGVLREALGRWRGDAFADLRDCAALLPSAVRLDGLRINAMQELFEREIRLRPHSVIAELEHAVETHPLDERFAGQLMTAQYRAGRQADALVTFQQLRRRLATELGLEPGQAIRELEGRILRHELEVAASPAASIERQRRRVTIVAAAFDFTEDDADPEQEFDVLAPLHQVARSRVVGHGGIVAGESASGLTACFGYPAREDAAVQAVAAAVALRDLSDPGRGVAVRAGVETGVVVVEAAGSTGDVLAGVSSLTGPPLRAAARLCDHAGAGEVRLGPGIADLVTGSFELAAGDRSAESGIVAVRRVGGTARPRGGPSSVVDRHEAIEALHILAAQATNGFRPVVVTGPPGIGKTAVVEAFADQLGSDWSTVTLHAGTGHELAPLHPFRVSVPEAFDGDNEPTVHQLVTALRRRWDGCRPLLVVEDAHLLDPSSLAVLDQLADHLPDGLLVMASRDPAPVELAGEVVPAIALGPLTATDARLLAQRSAGGKHLALAMLNGIVERSGGAPLHVVELTRTMIEDQAPDQLPATLYDSLMWRLDRLGAGRQLAQRCAVLGGSFTVEDVVELANGGTADDVHARLDEMVRIGVLRGEDDRFRFTSTLLADAAYESMLHSDRRTLHAGIADALEHSLGRQPIERVAAHLEASGRLVDAAVAWRRASGQAIRRHAHREALHHARRALEIAESLHPTDDPRVAETSSRALYLLAIALQATSHGSQELSDVIVRARAAGGPPPERSLVLDFIDISNRHALGDFVGATEVAESAVAKTEAAGNEMMNAFARGFLGSALVFRGLLDGGSAALEQAAAYFDHSDGPPDFGARTVGGQFALLAIVHTLRGNDAEAARSVARARAVITDDNGDGRCLVDTTSAIIDQLSDRPATVREHLEPVWLLAADIGSEFWLGWAQTLLGWAIAADDGPAGRAMMTEAVDNVTAVQGLPYFGLLLGSRLGEAGEYAEAIRRLTDAIDLASTTGELIWQPLLLLERATWRDAAGLAGASDDAAEALARARAMGATRVVERCEAWSPAVPSR